MVRPDRGALRHPTGPLVGLRGASGTRIRPASGGHGFPPGPCGVSTPFGLLPGRTSRPDCSGRRPPVRFRFPSEAHRSTPAPSRSPEGPARRTMLPSLSFLAPRHIPERRTRCVCGASGPARAASEVWSPPSRRPPPSLRAPCGTRAPSSFALPGLLLAPVGLPLGRPCPPDVARVTSPRSPVERNGRRRLQGLDPDVELVRGDPCESPRRCLPGLYPSRALSPPVLARALSSARGPPSRVGRD